MARHLAIKDNDIDNGPGLRVSVWFSGCPHRCKGCHNEESWDETKGKPFGNNEVASIIDMLNGDIKQDLSILGGEPLAPYNINATVALINTVKERAPHAKIWLWTGYEVEQLEDYGVMDALEFVDVIVDGRYVEAYHVDDAYRGSSNQRIIKHKESIKKA